MRTQTSAQEDELVARVSDFIVASVDTATGSVEDFRHNAGILSDVNASWTTAWINKIVAASLLAPNCIRIVTPKSISLRVDGLEVEVDHDDLAHTQTLPRLGNAPVLAKALTEGRTVVLGYSQVTDPVMRRVCWRAGAQLDHPVGASVFISPPRAEGFVPHFDAADNVVVQLRGSKRWTFFAEQAPRTAASTPWRSVSRFIDPPLTAHPTPLESRDLAAGDAIAFPSGTIHDVKGTDEPSIHVTFELLPLTYYDFEREELEVRAHFQRHAARAGLNYDDDTLIDYEQREPARLECHPAVDLLDAVARHRLLRRAYKVLPDAPLRLTSVLDSMSKDLASMSFRRRADVFVRLQQQATRVLVHTASEIVALPTSIADVIFRGEAFTDFDLSRIGSVSREQADTLLRRLIVLGLVDRDGEE